MRNAHPETLSTNRSIYLVEEQVCALVRVTGTWPFTGRDSELAIFREALADSSCRAFLIAGPQGVGKSRLAEECLRAAEDAGYKTWRTITLSGALFPLDALANAVPQGLDPNNPLASFRKIVEYLRSGSKRRGGDRPIAILVDDANLLDDASAAVLELLTGSGIAFMIVSIDEYRETPRSVSRLVYRDSTARCNLSYLDREAIVELLEATLQGLIEPRSVDYLFHVSEGNVLYLRELVIGAFGAGTLRFDGNLWEISGVQKPTPHLMDLVQKRVDSVEPEGRALLETLALCGVSGVYNQKEVSALESAGLVKVICHGRRTVLELTHPVYGEVLRAQVTPTRKSELLLEQAERVRAVGARREEDFRFIAQWELSARAEVDASTLLKGTRVARRSYDYEQVKVLAEATCRVDDGFWPRFLLGEALYELGEVQRSVEVLKSATARARGEDQYVYATLALCRVLLWALADPDEAFRLNSVAAERSHTPEGKATLTTARGVGLACMGKMDEAFEHLRNVSDIPNVHIRAVGQGALGAVLALRGRVEEGLATAREAYEERQNLIDPPALLHPSENIGAVACALQEAGSLNEAYTLILKGWNDASADNDPVSMTLMASSLARAALLNGRPRTARRWASQAAALARRQKYDGPLYPALALLAESFALIQDKAAALRIVNEMQGMTPWGTFLPELCLGKVWLAATRGQLSNARAYLVDGIAFARSMGHHSSEARLLTDFCRLAGTDSRIVERLSSLAEVSSGGFTAMRARFAKATQHRNADDLMRSAREFKDAGALLLCADATAQSAAVLQRNGNTRGTMASIRLMNRMRGKCEGAWTPMMAAAAAEVPLTGRELEIALLVADGHTNAEVGEQLFVSKRTVDNHLLSVFRKLGVDSRRDIKRALWDTCKHEPVSGGEESTKN
ncbi:LuxR C-terminal-related transcriptional regulator [Streptomyces sp. NPDC059828]|uniref:helix-turn-helix transcriptional regulator n=1 Tax=Streptomyces sp. NPDC059828 TaxID=3346965 RepID=UPI0036608697